MPVIRPPITGDLQLDSWTDQLTRTINQGLVPGAGGGGGTGTGIGARIATDGADGADGVSAVSVFMYQRSRTRAQGPTLPPDDAEYGFLAGTVIPIGAGNLQG